MTRRAASLATFLALLLSPLLPSQEDGGAAAEAAADALAGDMSDYLPGRGAWLQYRGDLVNSGVSHSRVPDWSKVGVAWSYFAGGSLTATPAFAEGRVIACDELGVVHSIDGATGRKVWTRRVGPGGAGNGIVVSSPMILDGRIFVATKAGVVYALDFEKGEILWEYAVEEREGDGDAARIYASPKGDARGVVISSTGGRTHCLDPETGQARWSIDLFRETGASAAILGPNVYVASKDRLLREIDYATGEIRRKIELPGTTHSTPAIGYGYAFLITFQKTFAVDLTRPEGPVVWTGEATSDDKLMATVGGDGAVYFPLGQYVYAQDAPSGRTAWKAKAGHKVTPSVLVGRSLCFASRDRKFYAVDVASGETVYEKDLGEGFHAGPIVVDGSVYLASDVNSGVRVYCLRELEKGEGASEDEGR